MKKFLSTLFLTSFLAVLVVPTMASAATCPNCATITVDCTCGTAVLNAAGGLYCYNTGVYSPLSACQAAMGTGGTGGMEQAPTIVTGPGDLVDKITTIGNWIFTILLVIAGVFLIISGFMFVTAGGNPENVTRARQYLINALIGVAVALAAKGLVLVVRNILGG